MIVLDITIVTVALPSIQADLGFSQAGLAWVVNAYLLTYGGFLLLGGRAGDLFGRRRLFAAGLASFTLASLLCGLAQSEGMLIAGRAVQGIGGAILAAVGLSLVVALFPEPVERAKAMGIYTFVAAGGGTVGVLLGGVLTDAFAWEWIFLVNLPVGAVTLALTPALMPDDRVQGRAGRIDWLGALTVTAAVVLAVYGIVGAEGSGWISGRTLGFLAAGVVVAIAFVVVETRAKEPLVPLSVFRLRSVWGANLVALVMAGAFFGWFFFTAQYMQRVLDFSPLETGLAFLPATISMGALSIGLSALAVSKFGARNVLVFGTVLVTVGLALFARSPVDGSFAADILPGMLVCGLGAPLAFMSLFFTAMGEVPEHEAGLASGLITTSQQIGGALGLAVLASLAAARTDSVAGSGGEAAASALNSGFRLAFVISAALALVTALLAAVLIRGRAEAAETVPAEA